MSRMVRARYTLEYKLEAVRLVRGGQPIGAVARGLGISDQTVHNWVKADAEGRLAATTIKPFTAEQAEIARLKIDVDISRSASGNMRVGEDPALFPVDQEPSTTGGPFVFMSKRVFH